LQPGEEQLNFYLIDYFVKLIGDLKTSGTIQFQFGGSEAVMPASMYSLVLWISSECIQDYMLHQM
jgi:hypothetical protein